MSNKNCIAGFQCPRFFSREPFYIDVRATALMYDAGSEYVTDIEWDDDHFCSCGKCKHAGIVSDFTEEATDAEG